MNTFIWACLITAILTLVHAAPAIDRQRTPTWFDLMPHLSPSKKGSGRLQQTAAHRKRRT